jgi:type IV pilus assembly protein PilC
MATFVWQGKTRDGSTKRGMIVADNEGAVVAQLRAQSIAPIRVRAKAKDLSEIFPFLTARVGAKEIVVFTRQFATMIDAGLPLVQCLDILATQQDHKAFKQILSAVKAEVEAGSTFAEALAKHPKVFDRLYVSLVAAGEVAGILDTILTRLATYMEKAEALKRKVKGAMVYPTSVLVIAIGVVVLMLVKVIPVFEQMFSDFGGALPGPTQIVISLSHFVQSYILHGLVGLVLFVALVRYIYSTEKGRWNFDTMFLKLPILGSVLRKVAVARFSRTLGTMLSSGVPILEALEIVAKTAGNVVIEKELMTTRAAIAEGQTIAEPLSKSKVFPGMVVRMVAVGEETGSMDAMLGKIADFYDEEVDAAVTAMTSMLEPLMMVVLGGSIGALLVAMYLPIFKIAETVQ